MVNIIGFSGDYGVGKTTLVQELVKKFPDIYYPLSFADALREELSLITGYTPGFLKEKPYLWVRDLLKGYANMKRNSGRNYWVHRLELKLKELEPLLGERTVLIDDVRFINEYDFIQNYSKKTKVISIGDNINTYDLPQIYLKSRSSGLILPKHPSLTKFFDLLKFHKDKTTIVLTPKLLKKVLKKGLRTIECNFKTGDILSVESTPLKLEVVNAFSLRGRNYINFKLHNQC